MPISKITAPSETPSAVADYQAQNALLSALLLAVQGAERIVGSNVVKGAVFLVGGATYLATADTAITGSASDYVKLTVSLDGLTLEPSYVADLTGVAWDSANNGYYDVDGNLYVFDELKALAGAAIAAAALRAIGGKNLAAGWATALTSALGTNWTTILAKAIVDFSAGAAGSYGYVDVTSSGWVIPAGFYMMSNDNGAQIQLHIKDSGGTWRGNTYSSPDGLVLSDGVNYRLYASSGARVHYRKLL